MRKKEHEQIQQLINMKTYKPTSQETPLDFDCECGTIGYYTFSEGRKQCPSCGRLVKIDLTQLLKENDDIRNRVGQTRGNIPKRSSLH